MHECRQCGGAVDRSHRFCPWCAAPQRAKLVEFFPPHPQLAEDEGKALRVTRYLGAEPQQRHVRFSVWHDGVAQGAVSLDEAEVERLRDYLAPRATRKSFIEQLLRQP